MTWRDVNLRYCVMGGFCRGCWSWWWWCDVKMVERWWWKTWEIECTPMAHSNNVWGLWLTVLFLWDVLLILHVFYSLWDFLMKFDAFWPLCQTRSFQNSLGFGVGGEEVMQRHACKSVLIVHEVWVCFLSRPRHFAQGTSALVSGFDLWKNSAALSGLTLLRLHALCCTFLGRCEISCFWIHALCCTLFFWDF